VSGQHRACHQISRLVACAPRTQSAVVAGEGGGTPTLFAEDYDHGGADGTGADEQAGPDGVGDGAGLGIALDGADVDGLHRRNLEGVAHRWRDDGAAATGDKTFETARDGGEGGVTGPGAGVGVDEDREQLDQEGQVGARGAGAVGVDQLVQGLRLTNHHPGQVLDPLGQVRQLIAGCLHALRRRGLRSVLRYCRTSVVNVCHLLRLACVFGSAPERFALLVWLIVGVYGIDLGTTNSAIATVDAGSRPRIVPGLDGSQTTPSVVLLASAYDHVVGEGARRQARLDPDNVCALVKRRMGDADWRFVAHGQTWSAPAISALILKSLISDASFSGEQVQRAVITVPAYFGDDERRATIQAGTYAGIEVAGVLSEPIAAALAYGFSKLTDAFASSTPDETVLVYDLGGGTFDATVIELADRRISVLSVDGDHQLGGADWDERIALHLSEAFRAEHPDAEDPLDDSAGSQALVLAAERAKHELSDAASTSVIVAHDGRRSVITLTRAQLEDLTGPLLKRTIELTRSCLAAARDRGASTINRVLLVGGSSRMPMVAEAIRGELGLNPQLSDPDLAVAKGAAIYGDKLEIERLVTADLRTRGRLADGAPPLSASSADLDESCGRVAAAFGLPVSGVRRMLEISVDTVVSRGFGILAVSNGDLRATWLVHRNQTLPIRVRRSFGTMRADQDIIELTVLEQAGQQESSRPEDAKVLIEGTIRDIPGGYEQGSEVQVTFEMGFDGVLHVTAFHVEAGIPLTMSAKTGATLSQAEVSRELEQVHRTRRRDG